MQKLRSDGWGPGENFSLIGEAMGKDLLIMKNSAL